MYIYIPRLKMGCDETMYNLFSHPLLILPHLRFQLATREVSGRPDRRCLTTVGRWSLSSPSSLSVSELFTRQRWPPDSLPGLTDRLRDSQNTYGFSNFGSKAWNCPGFWWLQFSTIPCLLISIFPLRDVLDFKASTSWFSVYLNDSTE